MSKFVQIRLSDLIQQAVRRKLIEAGSVNIDRQQVELWYEGRRHIFSPDDARRKLLAMLLQPTRERSETQAAPTPEAASQETLFREAVERRIGSPSSIDFLLLDGFVDLVLDFARRIGIITHYRKDPARATVDITIPACVTTFSYIEAVYYLVDSIMEELRAAPELERPDR